VPLPDSYSAAKTSILFSDSSWSFLSTRFGQPAMLRDGAPLESLAHLVFADPIADAFRMVANIMGISLRY
jgi:hypothetical protein